MTRRSPRDDSGAALLFVLIIITIAAVFTGAVLSYTDTAFRSTVATRQQAAENASADGAMQVAVNALRKDSFNLLAGQCTAGAASWLLPNFTPAVGTSSAASTLVSCSPDPASGGGGPTAANASPGNALLTLGTGIGGEEGISMSTNAATVRVRGGVFSNSTINLASAGMINTSVAPPTPYTIARGICSGSIAPLAITTCNYAAADTRGTDPGLLTPHGATFDLPTAPTTPGAIGPCTGGVTYQTVTPGLFTSAAAFNSTTGCASKIVLFTPGTYYFNFTGVGTHVWTVQNTYVIGGTPTVPLTVTPSVASMQSACIDPANALATTTTGVKFVFGGDSQLSLTHAGTPGGQMAMCASKTVNGPPIALYGLKNAVIGVSTVPAQSGCVVAVPPATRCAVVSTDNSTDTTMSVQGLAYLPRAWVDITLNNNPNRFFRWGLVARSLSISFATTGSPDVSQSFIDIPSAAASLTPSDSTIYLNSYVCPGLATCDSSGVGTSHLRLRAKVRVSPTVPRTITVLSWSTLR